MESAIINKIIPFSSVDGMGNRTAIFLQSCGFNCKYCHNPETINLCINCGCCVPYCKTGALTIENGKVHYNPVPCVLCDECFKHCPNGSTPRTQFLTTAEVMEQVNRNVPFIRGITVSGGECTRWPEFLKELFTLAKKQQLHTLIDSNGSYDFSSNEELMAVTDGVMLDIKAWTPDEHLQITGKDNSMVIENLNFLAESGKLPEVRTVVVPELFDCERTVRNVCEVLAKNQCFDTRYKIICYRPMGVRKEYKSLTPPESTFLQHLSSVAKSYGLKDVVII